MSTSPLTPQLIAAAGVGLERLDLQPVATRLDTEMDLPSRPGTSLAGPTLSPVSSIPMERSASAADDFFWASGQKAVELVYGKPRREHPAHPSYSLTLNDDQNTVGEYALHVLFTSVGLTKPKKHFTLAICSRPVSLSHRRRRSCPEPSLSPLTRSPKSSASVALVVTQLSISFLRL